MGHLDHYLPQAKEKNDEKTEQSPIKGKGKKKVGETRKIGEKNQ